MSWFDNLFSNGKKSKEKNNLNLKEKTPEQIKQINEELREKLLKEYGLNKSTPKKLMYGYTGIENIGNTCFMGSALQCLSNIGKLLLEILSKKILDLTWTKDLNTINPLGCRGKMIIEYYLLLEKIWTKKQNYISPKGIKKTLQTSFDRFVGYEQQDAQEFLGYFLDLLHEDLNKVLNKPYVSCDDYKDQQDLEEFSNKNWNQMKLRDNSIISISNSINFIKNIYIL